MLTRSVNPQIAIEKDVPRPEYSTGLVTRMFPFPNMEIGDSFLAPVEVSAKRVSQAAISWGRTNGHRKFSVRTTPSGIRCWRVA